MSAVDVPARWSARAHPPPHPLAVFPAFPSATSNRTSIFACLHAWQTKNTTGNGRRRSVFLFAFQLMEAVLRDVATRREPTNALEAGKFVLKPEVFAAEYDCTFFHQSLQVSKGAVQMGMEGGRGSGREEGREGYLA